MSDLSRWLLGAALLSTSACVGDVESAEDDRDQSNASVATKDDESPDEPYDETQSPPSDAYDDELEDDANAADGDAAVEQPVASPTTPDDRDSVPSAGPSPTPNPPRDSNDAPAPAAPPPVSAGCGDATETEELNLTNAARAAASRAPLVCDPLLTKVARAHSQDMCDNRYFSHTDLDGGSFATRIRDAGGSFRAGGENIAAGQPTSTAVHQAWMNSPGHRTNILNSGYARIGIGYAACAGRPYWTQVFTN